MTEEVVIFDGSDDIDDWEPVESSDSGDYNDYDIEFVDDFEEGDHWIGEYRKVFQFEQAESPSILFENHENEVTYAFPNHVALRSQVSDSELSENQSRAENPVEPGETVAIVYKGTREVEGRPMDMHVWELRRPPE